MRRIAFLLLILVLAGCKGTTGPLASRQREQKTDPLLNSEEQQRANRERYPLYADDPTVAPPTFNTGAGPTGR
jgi:hypothetical protein